MASDGQYRPVQHRRQQLPRQVPPLIPTINNAIPETTPDALILFEACLRGELSHSSRRPHESERERLIQSGNVFVFEESATGVKRWTDGRRWSPSRALDGYLVYRELNDPVDGAKAKKALKPKEKDGTKPKDPAAHFLSDEQRRRYVGSLFGTYDFKAGGLVKKAATMEYNGKSHHLVCYYTLEDAASGSLMVPSHPQSWLNVFRPRPGMKLTTKKTDDYSSGASPDYSGPVGYIHPVPMVGGQNQIQSNTDAFQHYGTPGDFTVPVQLNQNFGGSPHIHGQFGNTNGWDPRLAAPYQPYSYPADDHIRQPAYPLAGSHPSSYPPPGAYQTSQPPAYTNLPSYPASHTHSPTYPTAYRHPSLASLTPDELALLHQSVLPRTTPSRFSISNPAWTPAVQSSGPMVPQATPTALDPALASAGADLNNAHFDAHFDLDLDLGLGPQGFPYSNVNNNGPFGGFHNGP
ncbi:Gluconate transport-inducing protein required for gluconate-H+ symport [Cytospora paraplurivora]|uniref:Gluconate transport-inducing protein required for gluconate-H+ symport n=1 Tax=Cytospora paraplurivora TaxID=2898453 RepID=A0AAN9U2I7_9PEZI